MEADHELVRRYAKIVSPRITVTVCKDGRALTVTLSAHREFDRIERVGNVAMRLSYYTLKKIAELHDTKGVLGVEWRELPDGAAIAEVHRAWEAEGEHITDHYHDGRPLLNNCCDEPPSVFGGNTLEPVQNPPQVYALPTKPKGWPG